MREQIGYRNPVDGFGGMSGKPSENVGFVPALRQDVPQRFHLARRRRHRPNTASMRIGLHESVNAVLVRTLARCNGIPEHRRQNRLKRGDVAHHSFADHAFERGHHSGVEQRICDFPIRRIPTDKENFLCESLGHSDHKRRTGISTPSWNDQFRFEVALNDGIQVRPRGRRLCVPRELRIAEFLSRCRNLQARGSRNILFCSSCTQVDIIRVRRTRPQFD